MRELRGNFNDAATDNSLNYEQFWGQNPVVSMPFAKDGEKMESQANFLQTSMLLCSKIGTRRFVSTL